MGGDRGPMLSRGGIRPAARLTGRVGTLVVAGALIGAACGGRTTTPRVAPTGPGVTPQASHLVPDDPGAGSPPPPQGETAGGPGVPDVPDGEPPAGSPPPDAEEAGFVLTLTPGVATYDTVTTVAIGDTTQTRSTTDTDTIVAAGPRSWEVRVRSDFGESRELREISGGMLVRTAAGGSVDPPEGSDEPPPPQPGGQRYEPPQPLVPVRGHVGMSAGWSGRVLGEGGDATAEGEYTLTVLRVEDRTVLGATVAVAVVERVGSYRMPGRDGRCEGTAVTVWSLPWGLPVDETAEISCPAGTGEIPVEQRTTRTLRSWSPTE